MIQYIGVICTIFGIDTLSKEYIRKTLPLGQNKEIVKNKVFLRHIKNKGMAYHTAESKPHFVRWLTTILTGAMVAQFFELLKEKPQRTHALWGMSIVLGGAFGNLYDRWRNGFVTDFLYIRFRKAPIFNIADVAIVLGGLWCMFDSWFANTKK